MYEKVGGVVGGDKGSRGRPSHVCFRGVMTRELCPCMVLSEGVRVRLLVPGTCTPASWSRLPVPFSPCFHNNAPLTALLPPSLTLPCCS